MALTPAEPRNSFLREDEHNTKPEEFEEPPPVVVTPVGDMWPRPYYLENGLRRVQPYHYTYNTYCKERWRGRELLDIFSSEFRDRPVEYYKEGIENGAIVVNGKRASSIHHIVKNGDVISHTMHRHEPPVTAVPIGVVHEDDDIIVINKPAGVPVHPAGRYNYNSVVEILRAQRGYSFNPSPCNRLDRLTSGVMFIGKNRRAADELSVQIKARTVKKEYVARVVGEFPEGEIVCEKPILQISPKLGLNRVRANGKEARTVFRRLAYYPPREDANKSAAQREREDAQRRQAEKEGKPWKSLRGYSIVRCMPLTGRTHQIRVHLQFLGHPISNDPIYANQRVFGPSLARDDDRSDDDDDIMTRLGKMGKDEVAEAVAYHDEMVDDYNKRKAEKLSGHVCDVCSTPLYSDPGEHELGIYLHARRYACEEGRWSYETDLPPWALPPDGYEGPTEATVESDPLAADLAKLGLNEDGTVREERKKAEEQQEEIEQPEEQPAVAVAA
ncbi:tRNA pseudouridine(32) synthase [Lasiodiplodia hormozganensis]|uniref:Pseudouridine synthase n=1 Tax=Lasiodiplodia hormozganensis TaxID=869390 RepID=A0AA39Z5V8_9PEZI|nr:tRNA pseudouridine(32) synthase [Lasiodiplodia hormozganensis]